MDPFVELIELLRPQAMLWHRIQGRGRWGFAFRPHDDLLFCTVTAGECLLLREGEAPRRLQAGDLVLVRTDVPFRLASDSEVEALDSERVAVALTGLLQLGEPGEPTVELLGGRFFFDSTNESLLTGLLPPVLHVTFQDRRAPRIQALLAMNAEECASDEPGRALVLARLMELTLLEVLRDRGLGDRGAAERGLLAGLADPVTAVALRAMHARIAHGWTVVELSRLAGVSRSGFAERFRRQVGLGPIEYLQQWRMAVARDRLRHGHASVTEIAFAVGFESASAFSTAFTRVVGCSPSRYAGRSSEPV